MIWKEIKIENDSFESIPEWLRVYCYDKAIDTFYFPVIEQRTAILLAYKTNALIVGRDFDKERKYYFPVQWIIKNLPHYADSLKDWMENCSQKDRLDFYNG